MPINGGAHVGTNAAVQLSTVVPRDTFKQVDIKGGTGNTVRAYIGPSTVEVDGTDAFIELIPGGNWHADAFTDEDLKASWNDLYVVASTGELVHIVVVS